MPLVLGRDGKRLAKRAGAFAVAELRERGVPARRWWGCSRPGAGSADGGPATAAELVPGFSPHRVPREPVVVTEDDIIRRLGLGSRWKVD